MKPLSLFRMVVSSKEGWNDIARTHPSPWGAFLKIVLFPSSVAAGMILYAAWFHGDVYAPEVTFGYWAGVAVIFLLTSWGCVHVMAWFIRQAVHTDSRPSYADSYRLAAIAPVPIWLSALSLFVPIPLFNALAAILGLMASGGLIYHGLDALFEHDDSVRTEALAYTVFSVGALVWALIVALLVMPLL
ncbi:YIP1 family protein [Pseudogulbenkiania sp. MAI-1]|uniref:YIP1 family protein n=1 Tax=Pseudogulbenkiania sp. MAI-1 TaxID=990370 RepID=UPI00045E8C9D|nr:YIP1 family protein [Pseudogulbenkiania sp. MAI-1]